MSEGQLVRLHVYDISMGMAKVMSQGILGKQIDGIYHTGVVLGNTEYYFGDGIQRAPPGQTPFGQPTEVMDLGKTFVTQDLIDDFINDVKTRFCPENYNLITNNCNNFSDEFASFLVGTGIPQRIVGLPQEVAATPMGAMLLQNFMSPLEQQFKSVGQSNVYATMPQHQQQTLQSQPSTSATNQQPVVQYKDFDSV
eukprot:TRINITY_DN13134_c0_g2_i2.p1 TRINITY_DN13134_c0_g2~~TRINITY_DN13134_c0_g2_i2.p1  ORF type:complete len:196 (+),score=20.27 TRINITY_DN13134_c0_g2_i2:119-706(+)